MDIRKNPFFRILSAILTLSRHYAPQNEVAAVGSTPVNKLQTPVLLPPGPVQPGGRAEPKGLKPPENIIFKRYIDGKPVDLVSLRRWLYEHGIKRINKKYELFALWRFLKDKGLLDGSQLTTPNFLEQMTVWYPDEKAQYSGDEINLYKRGYLGDTPFYSWDRKKFREKRSYKQSMKGFDCLYAICQDLNDAYPEKGFRMSV